MEYVHKVEYFWAIKWDEVLVHATAYMNLEKTMLSEESLSQVHILNDSFHVKNLEYGNL